MKCASLAPHRYASVYLAIAANATHFCNCFHNMRRFLCVLERVKRLVNIHLHCIVSSLKTISKILTLPLTLEKFLPTPMCASKGPSMPPTISQKQWH